MRRALIILALAASLTPASAMADESSVSGYGGAGGRVQSQVEPGAPGGPAGDPTGTRSSGGGLPFTGLDVGLLLGGGMLLVLTGASLHRLSRRIA